MSMRKPKPEDAPEPVSPAEKKSAMARIIDRGGSVATTASGDDKRSVQLRVERTLLDRIDVAREAVPATIRASRHTWMMEAILEKLDRVEQ